ncbi:MAG: response regulator [Blastocatellia bacterium]
MKTSIESAAPLAKILIIEDQEIVSDGLRLLLDQRPGFNVVGTASHCQEALSIARQHQPNLALLDINLGLEYGLDCLPELLKISPECRVLVLTGERELDAHFAALRLGAYGIIQKTVGSEKLVEAVRRVHAGEAWLDGVLMARVLDDWNNQHAGAPATNGHALPIESAKPSIWSVPRDEGEEAKIARLTDREREVIQLIGQGMRNQQIADKLFISVITVRHHLSSIFNKLDVGDRFELAIYSYRHGLATPPM